MNEYHKDTRIYYEDLVVAQALINKDKKVTNEFFYKGCYPIFQSLYKRFDTDCQSPIELMNQVYLLILYPSKNTGKCQLENYKGESTLRSWIKTVAMFYCYKVFNGKTERVKLFEDKSGEVGDRFNDENYTNRIVNVEHVDNCNVSKVEIDTTNMIREDILRLISLMPNKRYAEVIRLFNIEEYTHNEVAHALGMTLTNLYNVKHRAVEQFELVCRKEEQNV